MKNENHDEIDEKFRKAFSDFKSDPYPGTKEEIFFKYYLQKKAHRERKLLSVSATFFREYKYAAAAVLGGLIFLSVFLIQKETRTSPVVIEGAANNKVTPETENHRALSVIDSASTDNSAKEGTAEKNNGTGRTKVRVFRTEEKYITVAAVEAKKIVQLPDSSKVYLNKNSKLEYAERFISGTREVRLTGEAFFDVKKRKEAFVIHTPQLQIRVLGTAFNVRSFPGKKEEVAVASGIVRVISKVNGEKLTLRKKEKVYLDSGNRLLKASADNPNEYSWKEDKLQFTKAPVSEVIRDVMDHYQIIILLTNDKINSCYFTGTFSHSSVEEVLQILALSVNGTFEKKNNQYVINGKGCN